MPDVAKTASDVAVDVPETVTVFVYKRRYQKERY